MAIQEPERADRIAARMDRPMTALGVVFLLVVLADTATRPTGGLAVAFEILGWVLWAVFVAEFVVRLQVAPDRKAFLRRNWWQVVFLVLPFLRFARILARLRAARLGRVVSSAVRTTRSAGAALSSRLAWLSMVTVIVVLSASQILFEAGGYPSYGEALHAAAMATVSGTALGVDSGLAKVMEIVLAAYSVVVFATFAGAVGAYFLSQREEPGA